MFSSCGVMLKVGTETSATFGALPKKRCLYEAKKLEKKTPTTYIHIYTHTYMCMYMCTYI